MSIIITLLAYLVWRQNNKFMQNKLIERMLLGSVPTAIEKAKNHKVGNPLR